MLANRSKNTKPEMQLRSALHARGLRFRVTMRPVPSLNRTADIVFTRARVAVFVDGCFWHGCTSHYVAPRANADYWRDKITRNQARDEDTANRLRAAGWLVIRVWEHDVSEVTAQEIFAAVTSR
jgi:DNA mismatch endonuclease (patch repair protein)